LENEITESLGAGGAGDSYENSWVHYLNLARDAADRADALGDQLVQAGLEGDLRSEQAQREVEKICGGMFNFDTPQGLSCYAVNQDDCDVIDQYIEENQPALKACLPEELGGDMKRIPFTAAGSNPLCLYQHKVTKAICGEDAGACPLVVKEGAGCDADDFSGLSADDFDFIYVENTLNIFHSDSPTDPGGIGTCGQDIAWLRMILSSSANDANRELAFKDIIEGAEWLRHGSIGNLAQGLGLDVYPLHHYAVTHGNAVLWTTRVIDPAQCPCKTPWLYDTLQDCIDDGQQLTGCVQGQAGTPSETALWPPDLPNEHQDWLLTELGLTEFGDVDPNALNHVLIRKLWGERMRSYILALGVLTGRQQPNFRQAGWWYHNRGGGRDNYTNGEIYNAGDLMPGLRLRLREESWADAPLICIRDLYPLIELKDNDNEHLTNYEADPGIAACHVREGGSVGDDSSGMFRFEYPVSFALRDWGQDNVTDFWASDGLAEFLTGSYGKPLGDTLWTMRSTYVDDLKVRPRLNADGIVELVFEESDRHTGWQDDRNEEYDPYTGIGWPFGEHITPTKLVDLLEFACKISERATDVVFQCDPTNPSAVPFVNSKADVKKLHAYLECAANDIHRVGERLIIPNLPDTLVAGFQTNGMESLYGEYSGENLKTLVLLEDNLRSLGTATENISTTLSLTAQDLRDVELALENLGIQTTITDLNTVRKVIRSAIEAIGATKGTKTISARSWVQVGLYTAIAGLDFAIGELEKDIIDNNEDLEYSRAIRAFIERMQGLSGVFNGIAHTYGQIQTNLATLDQNQNQASMWWAIGMGMDGDLAGHLFPVNTVMRRRQNTLRIRYEEAAKRAKKLAFIARRAIEFRLGVDLSKMHSELTLVPAPASWADRICEMQGFDYDRLRTAYPEDEELLDPELQNADNYAHWYIGDYVTLLFDFVQSYNQDFPFTDERDTAVISVRDDLLQAREPCKIPSRNMLYHSENVGKNTNLEDDGTGVTHLVGWQPGGCGEPGTITCCVETEPDECQAVDNCLARIPDDPRSEYCASDFCYGNNHENVQNATEPPNLHAAERLQDKALPVVVNGELQQNGRTNAWQNGGYYEQVVTGVASGDYILTWWARWPGEGPLTFPPPRYLVEVHETIGADPLVYDLNPRPETDWTPEEIRFHISQGQDLKIRIHPSDRNDTYETVGAAEFGDVWIWGVQLEKIHCPDGDCTGVEANEFQSTDHELTTTVQNCPDYDGSALRDRFNYRCVCVGFENGICPEGSFGASYRQCFWELPFEISLNQIEKGELIPSNNIAIGNFNYRHEAMSVNIVGTNVLQCEYPEDPASCYTNAFVPYTIQHDGWVEVKNYDRERMTYHMPIARVEHGKGLTAEVVITNPITGTHSQLLTDFWKDGLRGRPLQGQYLLRIWNADNLNWNAIEDIQIAWKYRYWTQMSGY
jgi:hypothetical protein